MKMDIMIKQSKLFGSGKYLKHGKIKQFKIFYSMSQVIYYLFLF